MKNKGKTKVLTKVVSKNVIKNLKGQPEEHLLRHYGTAHIQTKLATNVITCDESRIFLYDPESKRQSMHCMTQEMNISMNGHVKTE